MSIRRQHIRNTRAVLEAGTPLIGEYPYDTTLKTIRAGDGATLGGLLLKLWGRSYTLSPPQLAASQNDYNPADLSIAETILLDLSANWSITGLAGGAGNREVSIYNGSAFRLTMTNEDGASAAGNRFHFGSNLVLRPYQGVRLIYSATLARWLVLGRMDLGVTDLPEGLTLSGECRPAQVTVNVNDWDPVDTASALAWSTARAVTIYVNTDATHNVTGLAGGSKGRLAVIANNGANPVVLKSADVGSAAANRFDIAADVTLASKQCAILEYDATATRWRMLANTAGAAVAAGAVTSSTLDASAAGGNIVNGYLVWSVGAGALTVALKTRAGNDPSAADPVWVRVRDAAAGADADDWMKVTAALSVVISAGSSLGSNNGVAFRLWCVLFNDAGTPRLGLINCLSGTYIYPLGGWTIASSTAEGGAGAADNAQTFYTGAAVAAKSYAIVGYATWETGLAAAGTWSAPPTRAQMYGAGIPLPGHAWPLVRVDSGSVATGTTVMPIDNTVPQNTEGDQYLSASATPSSAANLLSVRAQLSLSTSATLGSPYAAALFQDANVNALKTVMQRSVAGSSITSPITILHKALAGVAVATAFKVRAGPGGAATMTLNGEAAGGYFGGTFNSYIEIEEIMT